MRVKTFKAQLAFTESLIVPITHNKAIPVCRNDYHPSLLVITNGVSIILFLMNI